MDKFVIRLLGSKCKWILRRFVFVCRICWKMCETFQMNIGLDLSFNIFFKYSIYFTCRVRYRSALCLASNPVMSCVSLLRFKKIIPIPEQSMVQMLCYLLECLLTPENTPPDCAKELYELYFVFAAVWAFGGAMFQDQVLCGPLGRSDAYWMVT